MRKINGLLRNLLLICIISVSSPEMEITLPFSTGYILDKFEDVQSLKAEALQSGYRAGQSSYKLDRHQLHDLQSQRDIIRKRLIQMQTKEQKEDFILNANVLLYINFVIRVGGGNIYDKVMGQEADIFQLMQQFDQELRKTLTDAVYVDLKKVVVDKTEKHFYGWFKKRKPARKPAPAPAGGLFRAPAVLAPHRPAAPASDAGSSSAPAPADASAKPAQLLIAAPASAAGSSPAPISVAGSSVDSVQSLSAAPASAGASAKPARAPAMKKPTQTILPPKVLAPHRPAQLTSLAPAALAPRPRPAAPPVSLPRPRPAAPASAAGSSAAPASAAGSSAEPAQSPSAAPAFAVGSSSARGSDAGSYSAPAFAVGSYSAPASAAGSSAEPASAVGSSPARGSDAGSYSARGSAAGSSDISTQSFTTQEVLSRLMSRDRSNPPAPQMSTSSSSTARANGTQATYMPYVPTGIPTSWILGTRPTANTSSGGSSTTAQQSSAEFRHTGSTSIFSRLIGLQPNRARPVAPPAPSIGAVAQAAGFNPTQISLRPKTGARQLKQEGESLASVAGSDQTRKRPLPQIDDELI